MLTGGLGYIGSHTAVVLAEAGFDVVLYDNLSHSKRSVLDRLKSISPFASPTSLKGWKIAYMSNLDALRDWGHAKDYVRMQWMMLQQDQPEDFVIATGMQYSVRQFVELCAIELGIKVRFEGQGR